MERIRSDRILTESGVQAGYVYIENGRIAAVTAQELPFDREWDRTGRIVSPGFVELHTHGGAGHDFLGSAADIVAACNFHLTHGATTVCPSLSAAPFERMRQAVLEARQAQQDEALLPNLPGVHMEGPYLSPEQCGAQCTDFMSDPAPEQYEGLLAEAGDAVARWTYAPERDPDGRFCRYLREHGVLPSAGHTNAVYDDMRAAEENGCRLVTHLYSCTSTVTRNQGFRSLGVIESAFLSDEMSVELIADGKHLSPELIKMILKIKGLERVTVCSDSLALAGTDVTHGRMVNTEFIIEDGVCKLRDRSAFAGSIATADVLVRVLTQQVGLALPQAVQLAARNPARLMGWNKGVLAPGYDADIVVFDDNIRIRDAFVMGRRVFSA